MSGPRERRPPRSQRWFDLGVAEDLQVAAGVDPDSVGRPAGRRWRFAGQSGSLRLTNARRVNVPRPGPPKTQPSAVVRIPFPPETPVPRDAFINREPSRQEGVEVVVAVASLQAGIDEADKPR